MCFRQRQTKPKETKAIWKDSVIIIKGKKGPQRMRLLQEQGNMEQPLTCCLQRPFPAGKQICEGTGEQISEIQNILSKITAVPRSKVTPSPGHLRSHCPGTAAPPLHSLQVPQLLCSSPGVNFELRPFCRYTLSFRREISKELILGTTSLSILLSRA